MNNRRLKIFIGICLFMGFFGIFKGVIDNEKAQIKRTISYEANISIEEKREMQKRYVEEFMGNLVIGNVDHAYEMLDEESKKEFKDKEGFKTFATTKLFNNKISPKSYNMTYVKQKENNKYLDVQYLIRFKVLDTSKLDYSTQETLDFIEYNTYDIVLRDYSPNNYKVVLYKTRIDE